MTNARIIIVVFAACLFLSSVSAQSEALADIQRIETRINQLATYGANTPGLMKRVAFSDGDIQARKYITVLMQAAGLTVTTDAAGNIDILFAPSGTLIGRGTTDAPIYLWVRNSNIPLTNPLAAGDDTIIVIFPQTGASAAHPVNTPGDPY